MSNDLGVLLFSPAISASKGVHNGLMFGYADQCTLSPGKRLPAYLHTVMV